MFAETFSKINLEISQTSSNMMVILDVQLETLQRRFLLSNDRSAVI